MQRTRLLYLALIAVTIMAILPFKELLFATSKPELPPGSRFEIHRVAHAGGGIGGRTYTNSLEALDHNIARGFRYFELDFSYTRDGGLVCLHDWKNNFRRSFGFLPERRLTLDEFERLLEARGDLHNCTLETLSEWMASNPQAIIVTDVKEANLKALKIIRHALPDADRRVIPQVYQPKNFSKIKELGFRQMIWTLYKYGEGNDQVLKWASTLPRPLAITMPEDRARTSLPEQLGNMGVPTYVHTINSETKYEFYLSRSVSEIYTDFLSPEG